LINNKQKSPKQQRVFCIGWHKTGTSTLGYALLELGYEVLGARLDMADSLLSGDYETPLQEAGRFNAIQDVPWAALFKELDERYPNSKFILTVRDEQDWLKSASKHFKDTYFALHEWLYGNGVMRGNEDIYLERFRKHYREVRAYFNNRPEDLLELNFEEGGARWEKLCGFLGEPIPNKRFPYLNRGKHNYSLKDRLRKYVKTMLPDKLLQWRLAILVKLGLHYGSNRFNNKHQNKSYREQKQL